MQRGKKSQENVQRRKEKEKVWPAVRQVLSQLAVCTRLPHQLSGPSVLRATPILQIRKGGLKRLTHSPKEEGRKVLQSEATGFQLMGASGFKFSGTSRRIWSQFQRCIQAVSGFQCLETSPSRTQTQTGQPSAHQWLWFQIHTASTTGSSLDQDRSPDTNQSSNQLIRFRLI